MALQTREFTGTTGSTYWTWKIKVIEENYIEDGVVSTNKVNITIEEYLGRKKGSGNSFFDGRATLKFTAGTQSKSKSFSGGADVKDNAWYKIGTHTFTVDNNGTNDNPTQLSVSGSLVDAAFSPKTAKASGALSLTPLHTPPTINSVSIIETNQQLITLGVTNDTLVQFLSQKKFTINATPYDDATITNYSVYHNNVLIGTSATNEVDVDFNDVSELIDSGTGYVGLTVAITDDLGGYKTKIFNYPVIKYTRPSIEATSTTIKRKTGWSEEQQENIVLTDDIAVLNFVGTCYKGNDVIGNANVPKVSYKIWNTTEPEYIELTTPNVANITIENYEISDILYTSVYQYKIQVSDNFNATEDNTKKVPTGQSVWTEYKDRVDFLKITQGNKNIFAYEKNDTFSLSENYFGGGYVTSSAESIQFTIPVDKSLANITSISVSSLKANFRSINGSYIGGNDTYISGGYDFSGDGNYTIQAEKCSNNLVSIWVIKSSDYNATNNTPVAIELEELILEFN